MLETAAFHSIFTLRPDLLPMVATDAEHGIEL